MSSSYIQNALIKDEKILYTGRVSLWALWAYFLIGIITLPLFGLGAIFILMAFITYWSTEFAITDKRIIAKYGFIRRSTVETRLGKIESLQVHQGIIGRIFNFGNLVISGAGEPQAPFLNVKDPMAFRRVFNEYTDSDTAKPAA